MAKQEKASPEALTPEERAYYRATWGFDPVEDKLGGFPPDPEPSRLGYPKTPVLFAYEMPVPLERDPELAATGVTLHARVEVSQGGASRNLIVFKRGDQSAAVECVHTAVYAAPAPEALNLPPHKLEALVTSTERRPALLPPWEHFASLKSFVAGLAAAGVLDIVRTSLIPRASDEDTDIVNWNLMLVVQLSDSLQRIAPEIAAPGFAEFFGTLLERAPIKWMEARWDWLLDLWGPVTGESGATELITRKDFLESLDTSARTKLVEIYLDLLTNYDPDYSIFDAEDLPAVLLAGDFGARMGAPLRLRLLRSLSKNPELYWGKKVVAEVIFTLFVQAVQQEDRAILDPDFLEHIDHAILACDYAFWDQHRCHFNSISRDYLRDLARAYITGWKKDTETRLGDIMIYVLNELISGDHGSPELQEILEDLNEFF